MRMHGAWLIMGAATLLALVACGGGGGSSSGSAIQTTGLVPDAPAAGAVLYPDALTLRPLLPGGVWTYQGIEQTVSSQTGAPASVALQYENVVRHLFGSTTSLPEASSNLDNAGTDTLNVQYSAGSVVDSGVLDYPDGTTRALNLVELRSPVRAGDQYTSLDIRLTDAGVDLDGDGRMDGVDLAIYTRVVGNETVDLPSYPQLLSLRTTTTVVVRFKLSATNTFTGTESATLDIWYAPGIGPVKRASDGPSSAVEYRSRTTELLSTWDGLSQGVGFLPAQRPKKPNGEPVRPALAVVGFDDHALMMSQAAEAAVQGVSLTQVDRRGAVISTKDYLGINAARTQFVRVGDSVRAVEATDAGIRMHAFDSAGNSLSSQPVQLRAGVFYGFLSGQPFVVGSSGNTLWLMAFPYTDSSQSQWELQLQPFDAAGQPLAAPTVVSTSSPLALGAVRASGWGSTLVLSWSERPNGVERTRYAVIRGEGAQTPSLHELDTSSSYNVIATPAATSTGVAMLWPGSLVINDERIGGVTLDAAGEALRSNASKVEYEALALPWVQRPAQLAIAGGERAFVFAIGSELSAITNSYEFVPVLVELQPGRGPLATDNEARLLAKGMPGVPNLVAGLAGNVLLFEGQGSEAVVTSVWRRP